MANIRRANSERSRPPGSPRGEVGEIDTRAPFQSVKAAVSLFGEVAVSRERRTPRRSKLSAENVIDKETQLLLAQKELNNLKQKTGTAETAKSKALSDLGRANITLQDLRTKLNAMSESKQAAIAAAESVKKRAEELELAKSQKYLDNNAQKQELDCAREQYAASASELDAAKQELNKTRQDFDAALELKQAAFQQAAEAQRASKAHFDKVSELTNEITAMKEATQQLRFATQQAQAEQESIVERKDSLRQSYQTVKEEALKKLMALKQEYDPDLTRNLEQRLAETTAEGEILQEEMRKVHTFEMDSVRFVTAELKEATRTLQQVADEECSLRDLVSSLKLELEDVKREQMELKKIDAERESIAAQRELEASKEYASEAQQLLSEAESARRQAEEMKKSAQELKQEAQTARREEEQLQKSLELALRKADEAKSSEENALHEMKALSEKDQDGGKVKISTEEYETLKNKINQSVTKAKTKLAAAAADLEAISARNEERNKKLEESLKAMDEIKAASEMAKKSAEMAEAARTMVEGELRRWRQQEERVTA